MSAEQVPAQPTTDFPYESKYEETYAEFKASRIEARRIQSEIDKKVGQVVQIQKELEVLKHEHERVRKNTERHGKRSRELLELEIKGW